MPPPLPAKIYVAGHCGMVGSAICRQLSDRSIEPIVASRDQLDLTDRSSVDDFYQNHRPGAVIFAAAKVGGIHANDAFPADFARDNVLMATASIDAAYRHGTRRFLFLGSTCIYPRMAPQPLTEDALLTGPLEPTNEAYALAKILGLKLCQYYRRQHGVTYHSAMPTNLYGPGDNYHPLHSHVIPGLIRRFHDAKVDRDATVSVWGSGRPRREFLHVDDLAAALLHLVALDDPPDWVNVGTGVDLTIAELARHVAAVVGYEGDIIQDPTKPDGTPIKRTDISAITATGWTPTIELIDGLKTTYADFLASEASRTLRAV